jgi:hypothetical protein
VVVNNFSSEHEWTNRCLNIVLRLRWFDREPISQRRSVDWRYAALIIATLFLNPHFWVSYGNELWMFCPIVPYTFIVAAVAVLSPALFFVAPAAITRATNLPLHRAVENAVGSVPAFGLRICTISFLVLWIANSIVVPAGWWLYSILRRGVSTKEVWIIVPAIVAFVFFTGLQSTKTIAKLALFGNKLGIAILLAAIIRVHDGLPEAMNGFPHNENPLPEFWRGLSLVMFYVAPLGFLAGNFGCLIQGRKQLAMTAVMGVALPLFAVLMMIGVTNVATIKSSFYQPSLNPNIPMALWGHAASSSLPGRMLIVAITMFGALRFGVRSLAESVAPKVPAGVRIPWIRLSALALATAWLSVHGGTAYLATALDASAACLVCAVAVLSADWLIRAWPTKRTPKVDWIGLTALLAGLVCIPCWHGITGAQSRSHTWLLPSYATGFLVCLLGRYIQKKSWATTAMQP